MQINPVIRTVITTGQFSDTYTQLRALLQEKHSLQDNLQQLQSADKTKSVADALFQTQTNINRIDQQIRQIQSEEDYKQKPASIRLQTEII
ncbi:hypothetical protein [Sporolactobacillus putidus]|uniref:Uncharacterized protein n=1 Tax=Sporolactobacillus putidus TaxID=492735 RepID=A0A917VZ50_9BACL|nr:hypothetical protein [Sporolactobacillus putidus]GGL47612.1 hypothetical protein GCM10007968_09640 [Sporolactobacillus putidus]